MGPLFPAFFGPILGRIRNLSKNNPIILPSPDSQLHKVVE